MKRLCWMLLPILLSGQFHRAEQDREIRYRLLDPATHQFEISHDFTITRVGQKSAHSFVRKGSTVIEGARMYNLGYRRGRCPPGVSAASRSTRSATIRHRWTTTASPCRATLPKRWAKAESVRIRCVESYTDAAGYYVKDGELVWSRTLGRPLNYVTLPAGWMLTRLDSPAAVTLDSEGRVTLRFTNIRNDTLAVNIHARKR